MQVSFASRGAGSAMAALALLLSSSATFADGAAIFRCRQLTEPAQRFACYEAIVVPTVAAAPAPQPSPPPAAAPPSAAQFGLEQKTTPAVLPYIESSIPGRFYGWGPNDKIVLANGQVWQISDDSRGALVSTDPKVTVRRGALGAFYLEIEGTNRSPKVRRAQ